MVEASKFIESTDLSPNGKRVLITARGDVFSAPAKDGPVRNLTRTPNSREIDATWSPDGTQFAYLSDASGEYEIWVRPVGGGDARQVTNDGTVWRFPPAWSPDSSMLIFGDKNQRLNLVDVANGKVRVIDSSTRNDITDYSWAPDSRFVAYVKNNELGTGSIWIHALGDKRNYRMTSEMTDETSPVFDPKGRYLYFLSSRDQDLQFSSIEFNYMVTDSTRVYAAQLNADQPALLLPKSDEVTSADDANGDNGKGRKRKERRVG